MVTRTLAYAVVVAACVVAVAVPVVIAQTGSGKVARLASGGTPEPGEGGSWKVVDRDEGDVDGDGIADQVRLRRRGGEYVGGPVRLEVELSGRGLVWTMALNDPLSTSIAGVIPLGRTELAQVVVWQTPRVLTKGSTLRVFGWRNGGLVEVPVLDEELPFGTGFAGRGVDFTTYWTTITSRGRLITFLTPARAAISPHAADVWEWQLDSRAISPKFVGTHCQHAGNTWSPCP